MKECSVEALIFECERPEDFNRIVCQKSEAPSKLLLAYRVLAELYSIAIGVWFICQVVLSPKDKFYISYLTWVQLFWSLGGECALATSVRTVFKFDSDSPQASLPWHAKVYWAAFSATLPAVVVSFIVFWAELPHDDINLLYVFMGNVTPFLSLVEFALVAFPLRIVHFLFFILHSIAYIVISLIYQKAKGKGMNDTVYILKDLNWEEPKHAVLACFIAVLVGEAAYVIFWGLSVLKLSKYCCRKET